MNRLTRRWVTAAAVVVGAIGTLGSGARAEPAPLVHEGVFEVPVSTLWELFTTEEGYRKFGVAKAAVDFRVGGTLKSVYDPGAEIGGPGTIEQTILAYEPMRMVAFRCTKPPEGFPFPNAMKNCWSVAYMEDLGDGRSRLTLKGFGYTDDEESRKMREFFLAGNAWVMQKLHQTLDGAAAPTRAPHDAASAGAEAARAGSPVSLGVDAPGAALEYEAVVRAPIADVWKLWSTHDGLKRFFGEDNKMELRVGGPFEVYFSMEAPEGSRGSEGCKVLSYLPGRMISFEWNAPPRFASCRGKRTFVVVTLEPAGDGATRVRLRHDGFAEKLTAEPEHAEEWNETRAYFAAAWPRVLTWLADACASGGR